MPGSWPWRRALITTESRTKCWFPTLSTNVGTSGDIQDVVSGVNLHSQDSSANSGVFVSKTKDDVKLPGGMQMELALRPVSATATGE